MSNTSAIKDSLKQAADNVAKYVADAIEMKVETSFVDLNAPDFDNPKLAARSVVRLDGDSRSVLPMQRDETGKLVVDAAVYDIHQQNVQAAITYRTEILERLLAVLRGD